MLLSVIGDGQCMVVAVVVVSGSGGRGVWCDGREK
jgi:hypothetical protein